MARLRFTDPTLQATYNCLAPADTGAPADTAEAIAAREGLYLTADPAAVRRRTARSAPTPQRAARRDDRRSLQALTFTMLSRPAAQLRGPELRSRAQAWGQVGL